MLSSASSTRSEGTTPLSGSDGASALTGSSSRCTSALSVSRNSATDASSGRSADAPPATSDARCIGENDGDITSHGAEIPARSRNTVSENAAASAAGISSNAAK